MIGILSLKMYSIEMENVALFLTFQAPHLGSIGYPGRTFPNSGRSVKFGNVDPQIWDWENCEMSGRV